MTTIYDFSLPSSTGEEVPLADYRDKVPLFVNTASKCGFTPQYEGLQELYDEYHDQGLEIFALPCNQFGRQEPGSNEEIQEFCQLNYGLTFPVMGKIDVNGRNAHPLYTFLKGEAGGLLTDAIKWNFTKFLVDRDGNVVKRFPPDYKPGSIAEHVEKLL